MEEKRIFKALSEHGAAFERIDSRHLTFNLSRNGVDGAGSSAIRNPQSAIPCDVVLIRCVSQIRGLCAARLLEQQGVRTVNTYRAIKVCGDKVLTTLALSEHGVPTPRTAVAFSQDTALEAMDAFGYPLVIKPPVGSWGRLMAKVNDREAAEAVLEHKRALDGDDPFYVQEYVDKPGRDIRTLVVGDKTVYAVYRHSPHWITNTARGGETAVCPITPEIDRISRAAAGVVGGEIVAVDLLEVPDGGLLVNEVNHTPEFHGAVEATDADVAARIVDYVLGVAENVERKTENVKRKR